jgi:hypothetical protein
MLLLLRKVDLAQIVGLADFLEQNVNANGAGALGVAKCGHAFPLLRLFRPVSPVRRAPVYAPDFRD